MDTLRERNLLEAALARRPCPLETVGLSGFELEFLEWSPCAAHGPHRVQGQLVGAVAVGTGGGGVWPGPRSRAGGGPS